jgi:hypothetical protein
MSLIVETGAGLANAESLCSIDDADAYHLSMGNDAWSNLDDDGKEVHLRRATMYMQQEYHDEWMGLRAQFTQALDWPRQGIVLCDEIIQFNVIPKEVKAACCELALRSISGPLRADLTQGVVRKQIGPIRIDYDKTSPLAKRYPFIDAMVQKFFGRGGNSLKIGRC